MTTDPISAPRREARDEARARALGVRLGGRKKLRAKPFEAQIVVDRQDWYGGLASLVLFGNVGNAFAGVKALDDAHPDDGLLEIGVGSADGVFQGAHART